MRKLIRLYFHVFHFTRFKGRENIPSGGPLLLASNHLSYYDPVLVVAGQDELMRAMAWEALFRSEWFAKLIGDWGAFPVDPTGSDPGGFRACLKHLKEGERVLVFPEGARSWDGELQPMREGIARLAMRADAPIVPVRVTGAHIAWNRGELAPSPWFRIDVHYLPPIHPRPVKGVKERRAESARIMEALRIALGGEVDEPSPPCPNVSAVLS